MQGPGSNVSEHYAEKPDTGCLRLLLCLKYPTWLQWNHSVPLQFQCLPALDVSCRSIQILPGTPEAFQAQRDTSGPGCQARLVAFQKNDISAVNSSAPSAGPCYRARVPLAVGGKALNALKEHPVFGFVDWCLRGIGQVVFQNNPVSGLIILGALFFNSPIYGAIAVFGVVISTATAVLLQADKGLIRDGLFGFNGALVALALIAFTSEDFHYGAVPSVYLTVYIAFGSAMTAMVFTSLANLLGPHRVAPLTMPFVLVGWLFLFAVLKFHSIDAGPLAKPVSPTQYDGTVQYTLATWYKGIGNAIGQIFFQDNWISGYLIVLGIAVNSRVSAIMALLGANVAAFVAVVYGAPEGAISDGLFGYNAALTAIALGGFFLVLTPASALYTLFGVVVSTWLWASVAIFLEPIGMPVLTSTFVIVTWLMLIGVNGFAALVPIAPADAVTPEANRRRYLKALREG